MPLWSSIWAKRYHVRIRDPVCLTFDYVVIQSTVQCFANKRVPKTRTDHVNSCCWPAISLASRRPITSVYYTFTEAWKKRPRSKTCSLIIAMRALCENNILSTRDVTAATSETRSYFRQSAEASWTPNTYQSSIQYIKVTTLSGVSYASVYEQTHSR